MIGISKKNEVFSINCLIITEKEMFVMKFIDCIFNKA